MFSALESERNSIFNDVRFLCLPVCRQRRLVLVLILCCHAIIHIIFLKPLYVPNILPQISVVWENLDIYLLLIKLKKMRFGVLSVFETGRGTFHRFQIATVVTINPFAYIAVENGLRDTTRKERKKTFNPNFFVVWCTRRVMRGTLAHKCCVHIMTRTHKGAHLCEMHIYKQCVWNGWA